MDSRIHKRSYSSFYKIYRRIRFIRFKRKLARSQNRLALEARKKEKEELRLKFREHRQSEAEQFRLKRKAERSEQKRLKAEMEKEFRERELLAREEWKQLSESDRIKLQAQLQQEKSERLAQRRLEKKQRKVNRIRFIRSINYRNFKERILNFRENAPKRRLFYTISFNSTILFVLSYFILYLVYQLVTIIAGGFFDYPMIVYYYEVYFNISTEAWYHDSVKTIFSSGPLILFVIGIIFLIIYSNIREMSGNFKLFFLWGFLHGINMLFGALLVGTLFETGVGHVISWMYIMDTGRMLYSTISIFILVVAGMMSLRHFLISGNAYFNEVTGENRGFLLRAQVLIPFFAGNAIIFLVRQPHFMYYETFTNMVLIICLLPIFVASGTAHDLFFDEDERKPRLEWIALVMLAVILLIYRGVLAMGIRIGG